jgi:hypothetical protein
VADDLQTDARRIMEMAKQRSLTLATAESCTAGALVHLLAEAPGAGDTLHGGFVVYSKAGPLCAPESISWKNLLAACTPESRLRHSTKERAEPQPVLSHAYYRAR